VRGDGFDGETALHLAVKKGNVDIAESLRVAGADLNQTTRSGQNALHIVRLLITVSTCHAVW
jgi:ankyrin repeat protein